MAHVGKEIRFHPAGSLQFLIRLLHNLDPHNGISSVMKDIQRSYMGILAS